MTYKILFVDDETANLRLLERLFRNDYEMLVAESGAEALEILSVHDVAVIISDQRMPEMTGIDFLKRAAEMRPQTVRIMLTGYTDAEALVEAINSGIVYKYITKPWNNEDLRHTIKRALQHYETIKAQRRLQLQNERLQSRLRSSKDGLLRVVGEMLEVKDPQSRVYAERVREVAIQIGENIGLARPELDTLAQAAFLNEAANFRIPSRMLFSHAGPTESEIQIVKEGFKLGLKLFQDIEELEEMTAILRFAHENYDGTGFPSGFARDQIPMQARIIAVANEFCKLTYPRGGQRQYTPAEAVERLRAMAGTVLDPDIVYSFCHPKRDYSVPVSNMPDAVWA